MLHLLKGPDLRCSTDKKEKRKIPAHSKIRTHDLSVMRHVFYRCATTAALFPGDGSSRVQRGLQRHRFDPADRADRLRRDRPDVHLPSDEPEVQRLGGEGRRGGLGLDSRPALHDRRQESPRHFALDFVIDFFVTSLGLGTKSGETSLDMNGT